MQARLPVSLGTLGTFEGSVAGFLARKLVCRNRDRFQFRRFGPPRQRAFSLVISRALEVRDANRLKGQWHAGPYALT